MSEYQNVECLKHGSGKMICGVCHEQELTAERKAREKAESRFHHSVLVEAAMLANYYKNERDKWKALADAPEHWLAERDRLIAEATRTLDRARDYVLSDRARVDEELEKLDAQLRTLAKEGKP